jgi:chromosome condensin MukBEF complex kleisin-like MukF subunit
MTGKKLPPLIRDPRKQQTEKFKRPNHPDFWTSAECKANKFSGVRKNDMALRWEFWILGNMEREVSYEQVTKDQYALTRAHCEVFYMTPDPKLFKR